ncbi:MAG: cation-efflux pump [Alphaproteobacteria bacterium]|nr:cation-efflux pump [Alphaproteobacteria bacterium]
MHTINEADREKRSAALASITAAILLTGLKLSVGLSTGSLGIISEAVHSALDLLAAGITYMAVRYAAFPPDTGHPYGHGKIENLSALVETLLLFIACSWIIWEAIDRLFFTHVEVRPSLWALGVMVISILVDISRSRMLRRVAKKHRSQALEADAIHFSTDIYSSAVVIAGLLALYVAEALPETSTLRPWLKQADALAALGVSAIILRIGWNLGRRAVNVLLDANDEPTAFAIRAALEKITGVKAITALRLRHSGPNLFADLTLSVAKGLLIDEIEQIRTEVESAIHKVAAHTEISVVFVPYEDGLPQDRIMKLRGLAALHGLVPHAVEMFDLGNGHRVIELHVEFPPETTLQDAHAQVSVFENAVQTAEEKHVTIVTHIEPLSTQKRETLASPADSERIRDAIRRIVAQEPLVRDVHNILVHSNSEGNCVSFHGRMEPNTSVDKAHSVCKRLETALHTNLPELSRITVHMEPFQE